MDLGEAIYFNANSIKRETAEDIQIAIKGKLYWFPKSETRVVNNKVYIAKWVIEKKFYLSKQ